MQHLSEQRLSELSEKWLKGTITQDELALLNEWYNTSMHENVNWTGGDLHEEQLKERLFYNVELNIADEAVVRRLRFKTFLYKAAAVITIMLGAATGYILLRGSQTEQTNIVASQPVKVNPDNYKKAVLILSNGQTMTLDDAANGVIAQQGATIINKTRDGELSYSSADGNTKVAKISINTLSTPIGGQYNISLPDGSKVWLNASSTLKFPTAFAGDERVVELTGEAYFEVAKNKAMPFRVKMANETSIKVLGTHFNIMAYPGEHSVNATLLEGSINVQKGKLNKTIAPGQMAEITDKIALQNVDADEAISWKNGLFRFERADVHTVMREIERWYNVEVLYDDGMPDNQITGYMSRSAELNEVLNMLELSGLKIKTQGNKVKVFKN